MSTTRPKVDAVIVGMGWTGAIMAKELTDAGLDVVALERGPDRDTQPDFSYPRVVDELEGSVHRKYLQSLSRETVTIRHGVGGTAVPYRQMGSFKPGTGVGGAGNGLEQAPAFPAIAGNASVLAPESSTLIRLVLGGGAMAGTQAAPSRLGMPAFAWRLSDDDAARRLTFIRGSWGNRASALGAGQVARTRADMASTETPR